MKRLLITLLLLGALAANGATANTEFYCTPTGDNLNAGSTTDDAARETATGGDWDSSTGVFSDVAMDLSDVTAGMWASVYADGSTVTGFIGRIAAVDDGANTVTINLAAIGGTAPSTSTANDRSIKIEGAWRGPNTNTTPSQAVPFGLIRATCTNTSESVPRVNFKNSATYYTTNAITHSIAGPVVFSGYTTTAGDGGKAILDGGGLHPAFVILTLSGGSILLQDFIFQNNGGSGNNNQLVNTMTTGGNMIFRCVFRNSRQSGLVMSAGGLVLECEAYGINIGGANPGHGFFTSVVDVWFVRCNAHDNAVANSVGLTSSSTQTVFDNCMAVSNSLDGIRIGGLCVVRNCDLLGNGGDGLDFNSSSATRAYVENCNFLGNAAWGINSSGSGKRMAFFYNNGFGAGTMANVSGNISSTVGFNDYGTISYASGAVPWSGYASGDFAIDLAAAKAVGRGAFTQVLTTPENRTVAKMDIGAAQAASTNAAAGGSYTFAQ